MLFKIRVIRQGLTEEVLSEHRPKWREGWSQCGAFLAEGIAGAKALGKECSW